tara:strand:- start:415 stop:801 length:387 start_codon:yes stop_codon:yes gene_type:complete
MILGVTGTRYEGRITKRQESKLISFLDNNNVAELHHGDCTGWDALAFILCILRSIRTVAHPPIDERFRSFTKSDLIMPAREYLDRNKDIVDAVDFLIAAPDGPERQRSGTWSTVRYAKKTGVKGVVFM